jgi:hypothetical protein
MDDATVSPEWERYGRAVIGSMLEVLEDAREEHHPLLLEAADYWLSLGLAIGLSRPGEAERLFSLIEAEEAARLELGEDAAAFCEEVLS